MRRACGHWSPLARSANGWARHIASCCSAPAEFRGCRAANCFHCCCWVPMTTSWRARVAAAVRAEASAAQETRGVRCTSRIRTAPAHSIRNWADTGDKAETGPPADRADTEETADTVERVDRPKRSRACGRQAHSTLRLRSGVARSRRANAQRPRRHRSRSHPVDEPTRRTLRATLSVVRECRLVRRRRSNSRSKTSARSCGVAGQYRSLSDE